MPDPKQGGFGHGDRIAEDLTRKPVGICFRPHPLLDDVRCQRPDGHTGPHRAERAGPDASLTLEWNDREEQAG